MSKYIKILNATNSVVGKVIISDEFYNALFMSAKQTQQSFLLCPAFTDKEIIYFTIENQSAKKGD